MEKFKIKSIDEFDLDFVAKYNEPKAEDAPEETDNVLSIDALVPEEESVTVQPESNPLDMPQTMVITPPEAEIPPQANAPIPPQPVAPQPMQAPKENKKSEKAKQSGLAITGKIIATILLVSTVVVFIMGCFVSVFIDNHNLNLGISLNTVNADTMNSSGADAETIVSKGDMIISTKPDSIEYFDILNGAKRNGESVLISYSSYPGDENSYSDIYLVKDVLSTSEENAVLIAANLTTPAPGYQSIEINTNDGSFHGIVKIYAPKLGGILHFASSGLNAVLVCLMFILIAAFWCLVLVLIDNQRYKSKKAKSKK